MPVVIELRSVSPKKLVVSAEAIDRRSPTAAGPVATAVPASPVSSSGLSSIAGASVSSYLGNASDSGKVSRPLPKGLRWESKTKFVGIEIESHGTVQLVFKAMITRSGIFDLKR